MLVSKSTGAAIRAILRRPFQRSVAVVYPLPMASESAGAVPTAGYRGGLKRRLDPWLCRDR